MLLHQTQSDFSLGSPPGSLADLYGTPSVAAPFPTARFQDLPQHRASLASVLDVVIQEEGPDEERYSSHTLPCRKAGPVAIAAAGNSRKDSLKSRIRRLSDWTGSLSRKKRRLQVRGERRGGKGERVRGDGETSVERDRRVWTGHVQI